MKGAVPTHRARCPPRPAGVPTELLAGHVLGGQAWSALCGQQRCGLCRCPGKEGSPAPASPSQPHPQPLASGGEGPLGPEVGHREAPRLRWPRAPGRVTQATSWAPVLWTGEGEGTQGLRVASVGSRGFPVCVLLGVKGPSYSEGSAGSVWPRSVCAQAAQRDGARRPDGDSTLPPCPRGSPTQWGPHTAVHGTFVTQLRVALRGSWPQPSSACTP